MSSDVTLRQLRYFVVLSDELNYRRAAERLYITQPALSTAVKQLERQFGVTLFVRTTHEVVLSEAGRAWLPVVREALTGVDTAVNRLEALAGPESGRLRVGYLIGTGADLLFRLIRDFESKYPKIRIEATEFDFGDPTAGLADVKTDVALIRPPVDLPDHLMVIVEAEQWVTCLPRDHPLAERSEVQIDELLLDPIICAPQTAGPWRDYWMAAESRGGRPATIGGVAATYESEATMVARGLGISFTTESMARLYQRPGITYVPIADRPLSYTALAWDPRRASPLAEALVELARRDAEVTDSDVRSPDLGGSST